MKNLEKKIRVHGQKYRDLLAAEWPERTDLTKNQAAHIIVRGKAGSELEFGNTRITADKISSLSEQIPISSQKAWGKTAGNSSAVVCRRA